MDLETTSTAYHEAGHALLAHLMGGVVVVTSVESEFDGHGGHTSVEWGQCSGAELGRRTGITALAGPAAEMTWRGAELLEEDLSEWAADEQALQMALALAGPPQEHGRFLELWMRELHSILGNPEYWELVCRLADHLEAHGTLESDLLTELLP